MGIFSLGRAAVNNELVAPTETVRCIKRKMGKEELITLNGQAYTPAMVSSFILKRLKMAAEEFLGHPVTKAVITVPAFFNEKQREATHEAALLAGLEPLRLLNEPTAAALAYTSRSDKPERCLVYDLGGGTFDVSIVDLARDLMEVRSSHGDTELGGADFDKFIAEKARQQFLEKHNIDIAHHPVAWARLLRAAEAAKIRMSTEPDATISEEFIATTKEGEPLHLHFYILRTEFEGMIRPSIERSIISVQKALELASMTAADLDRVILVGGSTYIPLVVEMLEDYLKITPQAHLNPASVVAMGAAIEAATLSGEHLGPMMVDVTPHSLGVTCLNHHGELFNHFLIHRNTPVPTTASHLFKKVYEEQDAVEIEVYQGESSLPSHNQLLGKFKLEGLKDSESGEIHVKFELDRSGIIHATVTDVASKKKVSHTLKRVANSRVKNVSLANLEKVHLATPVFPEPEEVALDQDEEELKWGKVVSIEDAEVELIGNTPHHSLSESLQEIIKKAQVLVDEGQLPDADLNELSNEMALAQTGDIAAVERLSNLLYFLD